MVWSVRVYAVSTRSRLNRLTRSVSPDAIPNPTRVAPPEGANARPGYHVKDRLEDRLHQLVCAGTMSLSAARAGIARDWPALYRRVFGAPAR